MVLEVTLTTRAQSRASSSKGKVTLTGCVPQTPWDFSLCVSKFYHWKARYGKANEHNAQVPRDHWLEASEKEVVLKFHAESSLEGYRRLCFMMLDRDIADVRPLSVYRVPHQAGLIQPHVPHTQRPGALSSRSRRTNIGTCTFRTSMGAGRMRQERGFLSSSVGPIRCGYYCAISGRKIGLQELRTVDDGAKTAENRRFEIPELATMF